MLPLLIALFDHVPLFRFSLVEQARKGTALVFALFDGLRVGGCLCFEPLLQGVNVALMLPAAVAELRVQPVAVVFGALQARAQILQVRSALFEKVFQLLLSGEGALKGFDRSRSFVERPFDDQHALPRVGGVAGCGSRVFGAG